MLTATLLGGVIAVAVLTSLRWVDATDPNLLPALQAATPLGLPVIVGLVVVAAVAERRRITLFAGVVLAVQLALLAPWWLADGRVSPEEAGDPLVVLAINVQYGLDGTAAVVSAVSDLDVDLLMLSEVTEGTLELLLDDDIEELLPHSTGRIDFESAGGYLFSRYPLTELDLPPVPELRYELPAASVETPGGAVVALSVHTVSPQLDDARVWREELAALTGWVEQVPPDVPLVLAGDFNATSDHPALRELTGAGLADAHEMLGHGRPRTWPENTRIPVPLLHLDHVLHRNFDVAGGGTVPMRDSDHTAIWAALAPRE